MIVRTLGDTTGNDTHVVRHLAAEYREHLMTFASYVEGLNIVLYECGVQLGRYSIVALIMRYKRRYVTDGRGGIDVIQGRQMIEVQDVRLQEIGTEHQRPQQLAVVRHLIGHAERIIQSQ